MKASEIRVGNWVTNSIGEEYQITPATILHLSVDSATVNSIPFTEEWLLRFGFSKSVIKNCFCIDCGEYEMEVSVHAFSGANEIYPSWFVSIKTGYGSQPVTTIKKYVHQLQNLYFSLTGEELTITE